VFSEDRIDIPYETKLQSFRRFFDRSSRYASLGVSSAAAAAANASNPAKASLAQRKLILVEGEVRSERLWCTFLLITFWSDLPLLSKEEQKAEFHAICRNLLQTARYRFRRSCTLSAALLVERPRVFGIQVPDCVQGYGPSRKNQ